MAKIRQLLILAGGRGTRLRHETSDLPKPLVHLFDQTTILGLLLDRYKTVFTDILILAGYKSEKIRDYIQENYHGDNIRVLCEETLCGTAGALFKHHEELDSAFAVMNGDTWFKSDLDILSLSLGSSQAGMVLTRVTDVARYGSVTRDISGLVRGFSEKNSRIKHGDHLINVGLYIFSKEVLSFVSSLPCSLETDVFPQLVEKGLLTSWVAEGKFLDIGIPETLEFARSNRSFFTE